MRNRKLVIGVFLLISGALFAQGSKQELLTHKPWKIKSDVMSGVGIHESLPKETQLSFSEDGSWQSTAPFQNAKQGQWRLENEGNTLVLITDEEIRYLIRTLSSSELSFRLKKNAATYTYSWSN